MGRRWLVAGIAVVGLLWSAPAASAVGYPMSPRLGLDLSPKQVRELAKKSVVPRATCRPGDKPDGAIQGQIPRSDRESGRAKQGYTCNLDLVGQAPGRSFASFDAYKSCVYMPDETWGSKIKLALTHAGIGKGRGVNVFDMTDPEHPRRTAILDSPIARAPDESMTVNAKRGLLVMNTTFDTRIDVYSIKEDCRHPELLGTFDMKPALGHAGWFSPDGLTYWMTNALGIGQRNLFPIDLTNPSKPKLMARWRTPTSDSSGHNGWTSDDNRTTYACSLSLIKQSTNRVLVLKSPEPGKGDFQQQENIVSFPVEGTACQDMKAVSYDGRPHLIANSEYTMGRALQKWQSPCGLFPKAISNFSRPEIFDISDIKNPKVVANLLLEGDDPANCHKSKGDSSYTSGAGLPGEVYDTHFCRPDRLKDPTILACAIFLGGLEVYDIRDPYNPKELAYWRGGTLGVKALLNPEWEGAGQNTVDDTFAPPVVKAARGEIWFGSYFTGLHVVRFPKDVYPFPESLTCSDDYYFDQYNPGHCPTSAASHGE